MDVKFSAYSPVISFIFLSFYFVLSLEQKWQVFVSFCLLLNFTFSSGAKDAYKWKLYSKSMVDTMYFCEIYRKFLPEINILGCVRRVYLWIKGEMESER